MASSSTILAGVVALSTSASRWHIIATAFTPPSNNINKLKSSSRPTSSSITTPRRASVYYPDGYIDDGYDAGYPDNDIFGFSNSNSPGIPSLFGQLATQLSSDPAIASTLARLASAFSPPGFDIELSHVNDVRCHSLDNRHLEIEAVVCDDMECNSLLIPVNFPEECNVDDTLQECVLRNVHHLDASGEHLLQEKEHIFAEEQEAQRAFEVLQSLDSEYMMSSTPVSSLPVWWAPPISDEDVSECDLLQQLLNGPDFQDMLRGLAMQMLSRMGDFETKTIRSVHVKAMGPEGMVLKVQMSLYGKTFEDDGGLNNESVMDVPVKFSEMSPGHDDYGQGAACAGQRSIREQVLMIVETV